MDRFASMFEDAMKRKNASARVGGNSDTQVTDMLVNALKRKSVSIKGGDPDLPFAEDSKCAMLERRVENNIAEAKTKLDDFAACLPRRPVARPEGFCEESVETYVDAIAEHFGKISNIKPKLKFVLIENALEGFVKNFPSEWWNKVVAWSRDMRNRINMLSDRHLITIATEHYHKAVDTIIQDIEDTWVKNYGHFPMEVISQKLPSGVIISCKIKIKMHRKRAKTSSSSNEEGKEEEEEEKQEEKN